MKIPFLIQLLAICLFAIALSSCAGFIAGATGQPIHPTAVQPPTGPPINVATSDVVRAQTGPPDTIYGLIDAGFIADVVRDIVKPSK